MATTDAVDLLKSIDRTLAAILHALQSQNVTASSMSAEPAYHDLDGKHGDPEVRAKDPRDYTGPSMKGRKFSECPAEYLDLLAARFDYFAGKETDEKKAAFNRKDAARARGWAARKRAAGSGFVNTVTGEIVEPESAASGFLDSCSEWPTEDEVF